MIPAKYLRIGNWVEWDDNYVQVIGIFENYILAKGYHDSKLAVNDLEPIPLQYLIPKYFDFQESDAFELEQVDHLNWSISFSPETFSERPKQYIISLAYLHDFQNLYFSLTHDDLNINYDEAKGWEIKKPQ